MTAPRLPGPPALRADGRRGAGAHRRQRLLGVTVVRGQGLEVGRLGVRVVTQRHDQQLGGERLAGVPGRALRLAAAAPRCTWKSSRPFQVKSWTAPTPRHRPPPCPPSRPCRRLPPTTSGRAAPSAVRPEGSRLNQMLGKARNRCQATPIVGWSEIVIIHAKEMRILTIATRYTAVASAAAASDQSPAIHPVSGKCNASGCLRLGLLDDGRLEAAEQEDGDGDEEDRRLDVVGLPEGRLEEPRLPAVDAGRRARVLPLLDHDQHDDPDEPGPREHLDDPLERREVPDEGSR